MIYYIYFRIMRKTTSYLNYLVLIFTLCTSVLIAQDTVDYVQKPNTPKENPKPFFDKEKLVYGGDIGLALGDVTFINISPMVGYKVSKRYVPGIGITYQYIRYNVYNFQTSIYGGSIFQRFYFFPFLFAHAEYQLLNGEFDPFSRERITLNNIWVGGGIQQRLGGIAGMSLMVLFNLNELPYSYPQSPWIRGGISFGI